MRSGDFRGLLAAATGRDPWLSRAPLTVVSTGTYWRNAWKYRARTYRHFGWDNGTVLANLFAMSQGPGLSPTGWCSGSSTRRSTALLDLDADREVALSLAAIGACRRRRPQLPVPSLERLPAQTGVAAQR